MDVKILINAKVFCESEGSGYISDVSFREGDYYISINFDDKDKKPKTYLASIALAKDLFDFEDIELNKYKKLLLDEIKNYKIEKERIEQEKAIRISRNDAINDLICKVKGDESIAVDLIRLFGDEKFENDLFEEAFKYLERTIKGLGYTLPQRICIIIALSYIALKYYDGDLHSYIEERAKQYFEYQDYPYSKIRNAVYSVLSDYRPKMKYYHPDSYVAVPVIMSCAPYYRVYDLFRLSYDIYKKKLLFDEDITDEQIYSKVKETLLTLRRKDLIDYSDTIKGTNYLMSKYTQSCIYSGVELDSLIAIITRCIRLIINHFTLPEDGFAIGTYYQMGFERWTELFDQDEKEKTRYEQNRVNSRPIFKLRNNEIYLSTGETEFDDSLDPNDVHIIVYCDGNKVEDYHVKDPNAIEYTDPDDALGGYVLRRCEIRLRCNPLNNLHYTVEVSGTEIYNSKNRLYRTVAFFDGKGKEIKPGSEYDGEIFVLSKTKNNDEYGDRIKTYRVGEGYFLSTIVVNSTDVFSFDGEPFVFYKIDGAKFLGYCVPWLEFESIEKKKYPVYVNAIILFQASCAIEDISINVDGRTYDYSDQEEIRYSTRVFSNKCDGNLAYTVKIYNLEAGYHKVKVINGFTGKDVKGTSFGFVFDPSLKKQYLRSKSNSVEYGFECSFVDNQIVDYQYGVPQIEYQSFVKNLGHGTMYLYPSTICFSVNETDWSEIDSRLCLSDVDDSVDQILFCGPKNLKTFYYIPGAAIETKETNLKGDNEFPTRYSLSLDYLRANKECRAITFVYGSRDRYLRINHTPFVLKNESNFYYDDNNSEHHFIVVYESVGEVLAVLKDLSTGEPFYSRPITSDTDIVIPESDIPETVHYVSVSLHAKKSNGLFSAFEEEPFFTFPKYEIHRYYFSVTEGYPQIDFSSKERVLKIHFKFDDADKAYLRIKPKGKSLTKYVFSKEINNDETVSIDAKLWPFEAYIIKLYPANIPKESMKYLDPVFRQELRTDSPVLRRKLYIKNFITEADETIPSGYNIYFAMVDEINGKYYLLCKLINNKKGIEINDVIVKLVEVNGNRIIGRIGLRRGDKLLKLKLGDKTYISKIELDLTGGQHE